MVMLTMLVDHLVFGRITSQIKIPFSSDEVSEVALVSKDDLAQRIQSSPQSFTPWFRLISYRLLMRDRVWTALAEGSPNSIRQLLKDFKHS